MHINLSRFYGTFRRDRAPNGSGAALFVRSGRLRTVRAPIFCGCPTGLNVVNHSRARENGLGIKRRS